MHARSCFSLLCLFLSFLRAGALFGYGVSRCLLTSTHEAVYLEQIYFNKVLLGQYNSTSGNFTGYTKIAKEVADDLNKNPSFLKQEQKNVETCKTKMPPAVDLLSKPVEPYVKLRSVETVSSRHPGMLLCSAYNFYPKQIRVTWLRDGKMVTSDVTSSDELSNGNWLYQIHSYLEYTPRPGEKITCMVEHASLKEPTLYDWDPMPESQRNKIAVGTAGLVLGLVLFLVGVIYYKRNATDRVLVPSS
ncbi:H-2 class II histocompatibility antigen, E-S beta chain-like isoform X1 [Seriola lalandi dorsalis]|uniref:DLA class II histocompatibility antigen, DR-1 beta chain-like n=1 Tax=Seriola lalandi dorsalis TaxID=1841481 RepID=A0A3B4XPU6_SERLL|nr:H-2 class II histocompatibility antigen, E-S beta chain-like isoform X1 [Seriola lalandi dorsalis]